jgi:4-diphosphocytidyl-2-C-methyl-D-erythritol kinase
VSLELIAPAKINLGLEILGRRVDGYHELVTVMQTINLADRVRLDYAPSIELEVGGEQLLGVPREGPRNLAFAAAHALAEAAGDPGLGVRIELSKNIPAGIGLGGGSSDAAAVLRGLDRLWRLNMPEEILMAVAASVGSDVPFFLAGGTAFVTGRGDHVEALPDPPARDLTLFLPDAEIDDKTRRMYAALSPNDYSDGHKTRVLAESVQRGLPLSSEDLFNVFGGKIGQLVEPVRGAMALCRDAGVPVFACGSGPGFFSLAPVSELPPLLRRGLHHDWGVQIAGCRSLNRAEATTIREA